MIKVRLPIIVEGKYDKIKLESVVEGFIITTDGFGIYKDKEKMALIRSFAQKDGVIVLTDSDGAGFQIRNHLKSCVNGGRIINVYIPDVFGKERRKANPSKEGKLGVEGIDVNTLEKAFSQAGVFTCESAPPWIDKATLLDNGLIGGENSSELRKKLCKKLSLPERLTTGALLDVLNRLFTQETYIKAMSEILSGDRKE